MEYIKKVDLLNKAVEVEYLGRPRLMVSVATIGQMSAVEVPYRPQGEWIDMGDFEQCSVCKGTRLKEFQSYYGKVTWIKTPYCPHCGCRMKGADDETD